MRRYAMLLGLVVALAGVGAPVDAAREQRVEGEVVVSMGPYRTQGLEVAACTMVGATTAYAASQDVSYAFPVAPWTGGAKFVLVPDAPAILDLIFRRGGGIPRTYSNQPGGPIQGRVPVDADEAIVCLAAGPPTRFTYIAR